MHFGGGAGLATGDLEIRRDRYSLADGRNLCRHRQWYGSVLLDQCSFRQNPGLGKW